MFDLRVLLDLLESAEEDLNANYSNLPDGLNKAITMLHEEIHRNG
jgi:hypothetical protein